ncbi:uncharacterized protein A4U43_C10F9680 [Asparagus officinalis]|uniref:Uncharacterized protein n=1 Tax=Asparagus officinalis TaxID=4686 RepID=A0A5P1E3I3_ASPOF|nr:uncharacterized protein A4U43_C10F9680 [Asparagus officinalis]
MGGAAEDDGRASEGGWERARDVRDPRLPSFVAMERRRARIENGGGAGEVGTAALGWSGRRSRRIRMEGVRSGNPAVGSEGEGNGVLDVVGFWGGGFLGSGDFGAGILVAVEVGFGEWRVLVRR